MCIRDRSTIVDDSGGTAPLDQSSLSAVAFAVSVSTDTDGDGVVDAEDADKDGDGILNIDEAEFVSIDQLGTPTGLNGADRLNVQTGDVYTFPGVFGGDDVRIEFTDVVINGAASASISNSGSLTISDHEDGNEDFLLYTLSVVEANSVTAANPAGIPIQLLNAELFIGDIDARNGDDFSDIGGVGPGGSTVDSVTAGSQLVNFAYPAGSSAAGYDNYALATYGIGNPDRFEPDFGVTFAYITFDSVNALHGVDGDDAGDRGAVLSLSEYVPIDTDGDGAPCLLYTSPSPRDS